MLGNEKYGTLGGKIMGTGPGLVGVVGKFRVRKGLLRKYCLSSALTEESLGENWGWERNTGRQGPEARAVFPRMWAGVAKLFRVDGPVRRQEEEAVETLFLVTWRGCAGGEPWCCQGSMGLQVRPKDWHSNAGVATSSVHDLGQETLHY